MLISNELGSFGMLAAVRTMSVVTIQIGARSEKSCLPMSHFVGVVQRTDVSLRRLKWITSFL